MSAIFQSAIRVGGGRLAAGAVVAGGATAASHTLLGMDWITAISGILTISVTLLWCYQGIQTIGNKRLERKRRELELEEHRLDIETKKRTVQLLDEVLEDDDKDDPI